MTNMFLSQSPISHCHIFFKRLHCTLPKYHIELHAIRKVSQHEPMLRSQVEFVPSEIMQLTV